MEPKNLTQEVPERSDSIRPRPLRIVLIALLAAVALTLAYPMSARKSTRTAPTEPQPQLSFSMRTVVRPETAKKTRRDSEAAGAEAADATPKFEGYVTQP